MNLEEFVDKYRLPLQIFLRITALILLGFAVYMAYSANMYREGYNSGVAYMEALNRHNLIAPCRIVVNQSGV